MPRLARTVFAKVPHHITQRGTLAEGDEPDQLTVNRRNIEKGLLCGSESFLKKLERKAGPSHQTGHSPEVQCRRENPDRAGRITWRRQYRGAVSSGRPAPEFVVPLEQGVSGSREKALGRGY